MDTPLLTPGERNDIKEDVRLYRRHLIEELSRIEMVEDKIADDATLIGLRGTIGRAVANRIDLPEYRPASTREYRDRAILQVKVNGWGKQS